MTVIPEIWRASFGGPALTGQCCLSIIGRSSAGPAVSVFDPDGLGTVDPLPAITALAYPLDHPLAPVDGQNDLFNLTTQIAGVAFPAGTRSVLFFGRHGTGPFCYDTAEICGDPADPYKGPHAYPYRHQVWAYDALDLASAVAGKRSPWEIRPYAVWPLTDMNAGGGSTIAGAAFDPLNGRIYITEAYGDHPAVHVYAFGGNTDACTTRLSASPSTPRYGTTITLTATVSGSNPTGVVSFNDEGRTLGTVPLTDGMSSFATNALSVGSHSLTAVYSGDATNPGSTSASLSLLVTKGEQAPLAVTADPPTLASGGAPGLLRATGGSGNGATSFSATGSAGLNCTINGNSLRAIGGSGTCRVIATKAADPNYGAVNSSPLSIPVVKSATTTVLASAPNPSFKGQSVTFNATVSGGSPTGRIAFQEGSTNLGYASLSAGRASWSSSTLAAGTHGITAYYAGDTNNGPSGSAIVVQIVSKRTSRTALTTSPNPARRGRTVTLTAVVDGTAPTGSVAFRDGTTTIGIRTLSGSRASITTSRLSVGTHSISASYGGDANHTASSASVSQVILR